MIAVMSMDSPFFSFVFFEIGFLVILFETVRMTYWIHRWCQVVVGVVKLRKRSIWMDQPSKVIDKQPF